MIKVTEKVGNITLPTMYELPSENPEEPGLPDLFHNFQPELLRRTFRPPNYADNRVFSASDLNLYFDSKHHLWYKRPDWFAVVGIPRLYEDRDLRLSYVIWDERVNPLIVVELLSEGTEDEDLGKTRSKPGQPPTKWEVYERILQIPYYVVFSRVTNEMKVLRLRGERYVELESKERRVWLPEIELGLGLWQGEYERQNRLWLRWYDRQGNWVLTEDEELTQFAQQQLELERQRADSAEQETESERLRAESAEERAESAEQRAAYLAQRLRDLGIEIE
jgi:Uma2 family endonuclease